MPPDRVAVLRQQLDLCHHRQTDAFPPLAVALRGLTAAQAAWVPAPGAHSVWQNVNHLTFWDSFLLRRLGGERPAGAPIDNDATFGGPGDPADEAGWSSARQGLLEVCSRLRAALDGETDAALERPVNSAGRPAGSMVGGMVMHDAYHVGQIVLTRRLQGSWPPEAPPGGGGVGAATGHVVEYRVLNQRPDDPPRRIEVAASPRDITRLGATGYLMRRGLFPGEALQRLRTAMDRLEARERGVRGPGEGLSTGRDFGGLFLRHLMDKDPAFLDLLRFPPTLSIARAMLGPLVQIRGMTARITYPDQPRQETHWHQHLRVVSVPAPPWFSRPHGLDVLVYLDDVDDATGPLCVLPGSHDRLDAEPAPHVFDDLPGQEVLYPAAGDAVLMHSNLWHRARPTTAQGRKRRLLLFSYAPTWLRPAPYGTKPADGLTQRLREGADPETRELLGLGGYT